MSSVLLPEHPEGPPSQPSAPLAARAASGARWSLADQLAQQVLRLTLTVVLARLVAPEAFGVVALAMVVVQLGGFLTEGGLSAVLMRERVLSDRLVSTATSASLAVGVVAGVLTAASAPAAAAFFHEPAVAPVLAGLAAALPVKGLAAVPRDLMRRRLLFRPLAIAGTASAAAGGALGVVLAVQGAGVWSLVAYFIGDAVVLLTLTWRAARRAGVVARWPGLRVDRAELRLLVAFGGWISAFRLLYWAQVSLDNVIVGKQLGATSLAYYGLAYRVMLFPLQKVADALAAVAMPALAAVQDDSRRMREGFSRAARLVALGCFPLSAGAALCAPLVIPLLFGPDWVPAVATLQVLCLNGPRLAVSRLNGALFQAVGKPRLDVLSVGVTTVLCIPAFLIGVRFGTVGVAWAYTVVGYATFPVGQWLAGRCLGVAWWWTSRQVANVAMATVVLCAYAVAALEASRGLGLSSRLALTVTAGTVGYLAFLRLVCPALLAETRAPNAGRSSIP